MSGLQLRGQRIPGSNLLRDFCARCLEPIRTDRPNGQQFCRQCDPPRIRPGTSGPVDPDAGGYQSIALRVLEDG